LNLKYDGPLSNVAFNRNLRHYHQDAAILQAALAAALADYPVLAGRVRVKSKTSATQELEVVLNDAGVGRAVCLPYESC